MATRQPRAADDASVAPPEAVVRPDAQAAQPGPVCAPVQFSPDSPGIDWPALVQRLDLPAGLPRALAQQSELRGVDGDRWLLRVPNAQLTRAGALDKLQAAVRTALGRDITLSAETGEVADSLSQREARARQQAQEQAHAAICGDALVQQLMRDLGAQIVPGSIKPLSEATRSSAA